MSENTEKGMKSLRLECKDSFFDLLLDEDTYSGLISDKNLQNEYGRVLFESNFLNDKRNIPKENDKEYKQKQYNLGPSQFSMVNNVGHSSSSKQESFELYSNRAKDRQNRLSLLNPTSKSPTSDFQQSESESDVESQSLLNPKAFLSCTSKTSNKENVFKWDNNSIKLLLNIRLGMEKDFCMPSCKKKKLWDKVASQLNEVVGSNRLTADVCDSKYRNLLGTYRVNKRKQNSTGEGAIKWDFFEIMDKVLGYKASSAPPKSFLGSTMDSDTSNQEIQDSEEDETGLESDASSTLSKKKKNKEELSLKRYLFLKFEKDVKKQHEQKERDDKKWEEKKELKLKEIEAINNLAAAIVSSNKNQK